MTSDDVDDTDDMDDWDFTWQTRVGRTEEFLLCLDEGMLEYFREMASEMVVRFAVSHAEAVARINERYQALYLDPYPDLMCHELPEFWAYGVYYQAEGDARLPCGDEGADAMVDFTRLKVRPAPPQSSAVWTLRDEPSGG
ncbi:hypothetical protein [Streptomyces sp. NPDC050564]|uniref:hypothetical protein n=1 Tax=Streptomyces sp. NPDC050564 TaxID=3365631 RepID=UPI00378B08C4